MEDQSLLDQVITCIYRANLLRAQESVLAGEDKGNPTDLAKAWTRADIVKQVDSCLEDKS